MTISALSVKTRMNRNLLAKYLDVLHYSGHLDMQVTGTAKVYFLSPQVPISAMLEFSSDYIVVLDAGLRVLQANGRLLSFLGLERDRVVGMRIDEIDHPFLHCIPLQEISLDPSQIGHSSKEVVATLDNEQYYFSLKQVPTLFEDGSSGLTLILEDITARRQAEIDIRNDIVMREFFTQKLLEFAELPPAADIYSAIGKGLDELVPNAIISINMYDSLKNEVGKKAIFGKDAEDLVARGISHNYNWDAAPASEEYITVHMTGKFFRVPGKTHHASFGLISQEVCNEIERDFNLGDIYSVGMVWRGRLLGNIMFFLKKGNVIPNISFIEIYVRVASLTLQRHIAESEYLAEVGAAHTERYSQ